MNFEWFRDLGHLARTGNFSEAAGLSNLSQPAFSRRIQGLETWVGVPLVDRSRQPVRLTRAGSQMLEVGQQAVDLVETERGQIREAQALPDKYTVTFGTQHSIGWRFFPTWLQEFEENFGPIMSRLRADDLPNCLNDLHHGQVDFVIAYHSQGSDGASEDVLRHFPARRRLRSQVIGQDALVPVSKPRLDGTPIFDLESQASDVPFLKFTDKAPIGLHMKPMLAATNLPERLQPVYENAMAGALRIRAREGLGVAWLPESLIAPDLESKNLVVAGNETLRVPLEIRIHSVSENTNHLTRSIWAFLGENSAHRAQARAKQFGLSPGSDETTHRT